MTTAALPKDTSVLAIGIEAYGDLGDAWVLRGAAAQAVRFAQWAVDRGVDPRRVHLGCVWAPDQQHSPGQPVGTDSAARTAFDELVRRGAHRAGTAGDELLETIEALTGEGGEFLLVYWCGHGATPDGSTRCLFTSKARKSNYANVRVEDLRVRLATRRPETYGPPSFVRQAFFIDACAVRLEPPPAFPPTGWAPCDPGEATQEIFFSTQIGRAARFSAGPEHITFSSAVLDWLHEKAGEGFPDFDRLADHVSAELQGLDDGFGQPVRFYRRGRGGDEDDWSSEVTRVLDASQVTMLAEAVRATGAEFPALRPRDSDYVRSRLRAGHRNLLDEFEGRANGEAERLAVARLREQVERQLWIHEPLRIIGRVDLDLLRRAYEFAAKDPHIVEDVLRTLSHAADLSGVRDLRAPLYRMLGYLHHTTELAAPICEWLEGELGILTEQLLRDCKPKAPIERTSILFDLSHFTTGGTHQLDVPVFVWRGASDFSRGEWRPTQTLTCAPDADSLRAAVRMALEVRLGANQAPLHGADKADDRLKADLTTVSFMLRRDQFKLRPESWTIDPWSWGEVAVSKDFPVIIHIADRILRGGLLDPWRTRLQRIHELHESAVRVPHIEWLAAGAEPSPVDLATTSCVGFRFTPKDTEPVNDPFFRAIRMGVPYLVWSDDEPRNRTSAHSQVTEILTQGGLHDVPERLHNSRNKLEDTGFVPRVIWDDETRIPAGLLTAIEGRA